MRLCFTVKPLRSRTDSRRNARNAELQNIIQAVVDAGTRNGWLAGHMTVGSGGQIDPSNSSKQSITRTLPVLDLTSWEMTPTPQGTAVLSKPESQHVDKSNQRAQDSETSIA